MVMIVAVYGRLCVEELGKEPFSDRVMHVMTRVPRHRFVPAELQEWAYEDMPLPIGQGKTISQPFMVALMTDLLAIKESDKVLEIGTHRADAELNVVVTRATQPAFRLPGQFLYDFD